MEYEKAKGTDLIVPSQMRVVHCSCFHCLRPFVDLIWPWSRIDVFEEIQPQLLPVTMGQFGVNPNVLLKQEVLNVKPDSSSFFP